MKAIYKGENGSMGFITGNVYVLRSKIDYLYIGNGLKQYCIVIYDTKSSRYCPYSSLESLLKNWKFID